MFYNINIASSHASVTKTTLAETGETNTSNILGARASQSTLILSTVSSQSINTNREKLGNSQFSYKL